MPILCCTRAVNVSTCVLLLQLATGTPVAINDSISFQRAVEARAPVIELSGYLRMAYSHQPTTVVTSNTTMTRAPLEVALLNSRLTQQQQAVYVSSGVTFTVEGLNIASALLEQSTGGDESSPTTLYVFLPCFILQPESMLVLKDLSLYWNPSDQYQVGQEELSSTSAFMHCCPVIGCACRILVVRRLSRC